MCCLASASYAECTSEKLEPQLVAFWEQIPFNLSLKTMEDPLVTV